MSHCCTVTVSNKSERVEPDPEFADSMKPWHVDTFTVTFAGLERDYAIRAFAQVVHEAQSIMKRFNGRHENPEWFDMRNLV